MALAQHKAEEGAFRNLGKRSAFDYGSVGGGDKAGPDAPH